MKRILSLILGITVAAGLCVGLSGCGKKADSSTLVWYIVGDKPAAHDEVMAEANKIIEEKIGMKLDLEYIDSASYTEKMKLKMASGEPYDLAFTGYVNSYQTAVNLGGLYDITELVSETGLDKVIPEYYLDAARVKGKIYGVPNIQVISNSADITILESIAEETGVIEDLEEIEEKSSIHNSYEELVEISKIYDRMFEKVHTKRPDLYTWNPSDAPFTSVYESLPGGAALRCDGTSKKFVNIYKTDEFKLYIQKNREWYQKGYIRNDIASVGNALPGVEERKQVAFAKNTWKPGENAYDINTYGERFAYAKVVDPYVQKSSALLTMISVGANSKNPKKAVEFIKLINTDKELYNLICWGIEGKHYIKNDDGTVSPVEGSGYENVSAAAWEYGNQFNSFVAEGQPVDVWVQTQKMNDEADKSPMLGFVPDTTAIETELANISSVTSEYKAKKDFGTEDVSVWYDEFISKLETAGIQKVIDEMQKQYDEFFASK